MLRFLLMAVALIVLSGCVTRQVAVSYSPPAPATLPAGDRYPIVRVKTVIDERHDGPNWLGAIRGGFGNPLKTLETERPVKDLVARAFSSGLAARGMLAPAGKENLDLDITIHRYECNQYVRKEAHLDLDVSLVDARTGRRVYADRVRTDKVVGSLVAFDTGVFGSVDRLRMVAAAVLDEAIDTELDKAPFRAAVARAAAE